MANCVFGWPIYSDAGALYTPTLSGGSWESDLPRTNVQDRRLSRVARSVDAQTSSTQFEIDLMVARAVRVIAVVLPNISASGTVRVRASSSAGSFGSPIYDSGIVTPYPSGHDAETLGGILPTFVTVPTAAQTARYWLVEIADTGNTDGYRDVARLVIAGGWQPSINMNRGARLGLETETERQVTDGGPAVYNVRPRRRTMDFEIEHLPDNEALGSGFDMQRIAGTSGQFFFVFDPDDTTHMFRRAFLAVLRQLSALEYAHHNMNAMAYQVVEEL